WSSSRYTLLPYTTLFRSVIDELDAIRALGLRDLVLVVRELQVLAAAVDVEMLAEQRAAHGGAFDVPARPPFAVARRPLRLVGLRSEEHTSELQSPDHLVC